MPTDKKKVTSQSHGTKFFLFSKKNKQNSKKKILTKLNIPKKYKLLQKTEFFFSLK